MRRGREQHKTFVGVDETTHLILTRFVGSKFGKRLKRRLFEEERDLKELALAVGNRRRLKTRFALLRTSFFVLVVENLEASRLTRGTIFRLAAD